ncbi:MAG: ABC transporter substrate-binding protein [Solirubrobacterales bacterium]
MVLPVSLAACGSQGGSETTVSASVQKFATPGTSIPSAHVNWGMAPFPDEVLPYVGMRLGYFKDVGIDIGPTPSGAKVDCTGSIAPLLTGQVDICSGALEALVSNLDNTQEVRSFVSMDTVDGLGIFIPPGSSAKSVQDFMNEGDSFSVAIQKAMAQLKGKRVALATDPAARLLYNIAFSLGHITPDQFQRSDLSNPNIVSLALAGKTDFPAPSGGAEVVRLLGAGFRPMVTQAQIQKFSNDPRRFETAIHGSFITTNSYYNDHYDTILRAASVVYRILALAHTDFPALARVELPFINAYAGQNLSQAQLHDELTNFAVLRTFDTVAPFYNGSGADAALNIETTVNAQIQALRRAGVLKQEHTAADIVGSAKVWHDLMDLRARCDQLFKQVGSGGSNASTVQAAREQYAHLNFLDAYRFLASIQQ